MVCILLLGCAKDDGPARKQEDFNSLYGGLPYKGKVQGRIFLEEKEISLAGNGTIALIEGTKDSVSVVFLADIEDLGEINLKIRGRFGRESFFLENESSDMFFRIMNQEIEGRFISESQEMTFVGNLGREKGQMKMTAVFKQETDSFPTGTRLYLDFDTGRRVTEDDDLSGCQMRMVPIWGPNGMTMGMVPDC